MRIVVREVPARTNNYFCTAEKHWSCTRANEDFVMRTINEACLGVGIGLGSFSAGPPTTPAKMEVLATEDGDFENYYGK